MHCLVALKLNHAAPSQRIIVTQNGQLHMFRMHQMLGIKYDTKVLSQPNLQDIEGKEFLNNIYTDEDAEMNQRIHMF
jgi:hypothetical protein